MKKKKRAFGVNKIVGVFEKKIFTEIWQKIKPEKKKRKEKRWGGVYEREGILI